MYSVDIIKRTLAEAIAAMDRLGLGFRVVAGKVQGRNGRPDAFVDLRFGARRLRYAVEVRRGLRPATLGAIIHQLRHHGATLLVADYVTPALADRLQAEGVEFIDAAGNAFLNDPPLFVFVKGQRPMNDLAAGERGRAFQPTGLRVLFAFLAEPGLIGRPYRQIAKAAGVAHGTVGWVMAELPGLGYMTEARGRRRLVNGERLLEQWTEAYARTLRPRLLLRRFHGALDDAVARAARWKDGLLLGGEPAAARLTRHLRPGTATFYAKEIDPAVVADLRLRADPKGNVEFRRRFWAFPGRDPDLAPTLLVYADLLAIGDDRCLETAQLLRGDLVDRLGRSR